MPSIFSTAGRPIPSTRRKTIQAAAEGGAMIVVLCDTNGGSMPEEVAALAKEAATVD